LVDKKLTEVAKTKHLGLDLKRAYTLDQIELEQPIIESQKQYLKFPFTIFPLTKERGSEHVPFRETRATRQPLPEPSMVT